MPSKSPAQRRLMAAAAHTPGGYGGVPQSVGKEFNEADTGKPSHISRTVGTAVQQGHTWNQAVAGAIRAHRAVGSKAAPQPGQAGGRPKVRW
jgi:hypothetical protein